jgi:hypothetical protein
MCAVHANYITITPNAIELVGSLRVRYGEKSYNKKAYAAYTAKMSNPIDPN